MRGIYIPDRALIYFASVPRVDMTGGIWPLYEYSETGPYGSQAIGIPGCTLEGFLFHVDVPDMRDSLEPSIEETLVSAIWIATGISVWSR
jgi:hypothetical protein